MHRPGARGPLRDSDQGDPAPGYASPVAPKTVSPKRRTAFTTTVFMKRLMAWSGIVFLLFVIFHMYGNTHYFEGEIAYDHYTDYEIGRASCRERV